MAPAFTVYLNSERTTAYFVNLDESESMTKPSFSLEITSQQLEILESILGDGNLDTSNYDLKQLAGHHLFVKTLKEKKAIVEV